MRTIKFVTNHRLDPEKGWELILSWLKKELSRQSPVTSIQFDIYGQGKMQDEVEALAKTYPDNIRYHGFVPIHQIFQGAMDYDFVLMPSTFLETFGLSALDFAQFGIPTIGYKKGGVAPFISDYLNISNYPGQGQEQFDTALNTIVENTTKQKETGIKAESITVDTNKIRTEYGTKHWLEQFKSILM